MKINYNQIFSQGLKAHQEGRFEEAERLYREILKAEPKNLNAYNNLGAILQRHGKADEAEKCFKKVLELNPDYTNAHNNLGIILNDSGKFDEAETSFKKAIELKPDYAEAHNNLGNVLKNLDKFDEAEACYGKAIELKPDYAEAHNNLSILLYDLGRFNEAEVSYKKAIELKPDYIEAYYNLGVTLQELGRLDEAEASYRKATELKPNHVKALNNLGVLMYNLDRLDEAITFYNKAIEFNPNFVEALLNRGEILLRKGQYEHALKDFDTFKNSKESRFQALYALYALGRIEEIYQRLDMQFKLDDKNLGVAAFSSFITAKERRETKYNFCNNPIDFIHTSNLKPHLKDFNLFINELIEELYNINTYWEPFGKTTKKGFQSINNIFKNSSGTLNKLKSIIMNELDSYYSKFKDKDCSFIKKWPYKKNIYGWHVILKQHGHQNAHIHPSGWLSGVIYLKVVPPFDKNEGAIEFGLNGENYFDINSPKLIHQPKLGDIVLFPSSLHHRTIPFSTSTDRIIVSFDLQPNSKN